MIGVLLWTVIALVAAIIVARWQNGHSPCTSCPGCLYELTGLAPGETERCPECGAVLGEVGVVRSACPPKRTPRFYRWMLRLALLPLILVLLMQLLVDPPIERVHRRVWEVEFGVPGMGGEVLRLRVEAEKRMRPGVGFDSAADDWADGRPRQFVIEADLGYDAVLTSSAHPGEEFAITDAMPVHPDASPAWNDRVSRQPGAYEWVQLHAPAADEIFVWWVAASWPDEATRGDSPYLAGSIGIGHIKETELRSELNGVPVTAGSMFDRLRRMYGVCSLEHSGWRHLLMALVYAVTI